MARTVLRWAAVLPAAVGGYVAAVVGVQLAFAIVPNDSMYWLVGALLGWIFGLPTDARELTTDILLS